MEKRKKWQHYSVEFKRKAVALGREIGANKAGPRLGIERDTLRSWIQREDFGEKMSADDSPDKRAAKIAEREIKRLKRENEELKKANRVLKEIASVFSRDRPDSDLRRSENSPTKKK